MKSVVRVTAALILVFSLMASAHAQKSGLYIGIMSGATFLNNTNLESESIPSGGEIRTSWQTGFYIGAVVGYRLSNYLRLDAELTYRGNDLDLLEAAGPGFNSVSRQGDIQSAAFLGNVWFDIGLGELPITPYVGGGVGLGGVEIKLEPVSLPFSGTFLTDESETAAVFAYQLGAGIGYSLDEHLTLSLDYRFFGTTDPEFLLIRKASADYQTHNFGVSFRFAF